jgi:hypothetical protein
VTNRNFGPDGGQEGGKAPIKLRKKKSFLNNKKGRRVYRRQCSRNLERKEVF